MTNLWQSAARAAEIIGQDGANSIPLADGSTLWTFGDTWLGRDRHKPDGAVGLARVPVAHIREPAAYEFWTGQGHDFSSSRTKVAPLVRDVWGQVSVAWNPYLKRLVMLHVGGVFREPRSVFLRTAESPAGPWSKPTRVFSLGGGLGKDFAGLLYCPFLHPELFREHGRIMAFTYCMHGDMFGNPSLVEMEIDRE